MTKEIIPNAVYTTKETEELMKISSSTMKRLLKRGMIKANKVGKQYRILGLEILRVLSPEIEKKAVDKYLGLKDKVIKKIDKW